MVICISLMVLAVLPIPVVFIIRRCNLIDDSSGNLASVTYKRGRVLKEPINLEEMMQASFMARYQARCPLQISVKIFIENKVDRQLWIQLPTDAMG